MRPQAGRILAGGLCIGLLLGVAGCSRWEARFPFVGADTTHIGTKLLRPEGRARSCAVHVLGWPRDASAVEQAVRMLLATDAEANGIANLHVEVTGFGLGFIGRTCATVSGDIVRMTSLALVPGLEHPRHDTHR